MEKYIYQQERTFILYRVSFSLRILTESRALVRGSLNADDA